MRYIVKSVVCDYGVFEKTDNREQLKVICNSLSNAKLIADILNTDLRNTKYEVIERSEYEKIKFERDISIQQIHNLGNSVSTAIEEMEIEYNNLTYTENHNLGANYGIRKSIEILKRNIGGQL